MLDSIDTTTSNDFSMSKLTLDSAGSQPEDWDRSLNLTDDPDGQLDLSGGTRPTTPRNSVVFPAETGLPNLPTGHDDPQATPSKRSISKATSSRFRDRTKRSLTQMLKDQQGGGSGGGNHFSSDEVSQVANVLGQWINASSSPYEDEDDFFARQSHDDLAVPSPRLTLKDPRGRTVSAASTSSRSSVKGDAKGH